MTLFGLVVTSALLALVPQIALTQRVSFVSPTNGSTIAVGKPLTVVLQVESTTSSVKTLSFAFGFNAKDNQDSKSLGRPYVDMIAVGDGPNQTKISSQLTYTMNITVPPAESFVDGFSSGYALKVSNYYLLGATQTPMIQLASVSVTVSNATGGSNPVPSGSSSSAATGGNSGNTSGGNNASSPTPGGSSGNTSGQSKISTDYVTQTAFLLASGVFFVFL
ncbi:hypothetical protein O181_066999 [Austropuccinia psidii MF-1]|uniref:Secreted protein n=1 Tax=Austropuccinia psidii MF-1 TaxID=1389203 RepID=A0A9Q3EUJ1_9BASI|nr:hypothetical protein [Austropuccinia psidii MF-1]